MYPICKIYVSDNKMNVTMNLMPLIPYADWMVSITYWGANQYVICKTGVGIGQHIYDFIKQ